MQTRWKADESAQRIILKPENWRIPIANGMNGMTALTLKLPHRLTEVQFYRICRANPELRLERTATGESQRGHCKNLGAWTFRGDNDLESVTDTRVELVCIHQLYGWPVLSLTYGYTPREGAREVGLKASGHTIALLAAVMRGKTSAQSIEFLPTRKAYTLKGQEYPTLVGWAFRNRESSTGP